MKIKKMVLLFCMFIGANSQAVDLVFRLDKNNLQCTGEIYLEYYRTCGEDFTHRRQQCGSIVGPLAEFEKSHEHLVSNEPDGYFCQTCDHIKVVDKKTAITRYICILANTFGVASDNQKVRKELFENYLKDIDYKDFSLIYNSIADFKKIHHKFARANHTLSVHHEWDDDSEYSSRIMVHYLFSDMNPKSFLHFLNYISDETRSLPTDGISLLDSYDNITFQIPFSYLNPNAEKELRMFDWQTFLKLRDRVKLGFKNESTTKVAILNTFLTRYYYKYIQSLEEIEFKIRLLKIRFNMSQDSNFEEVKKFKIELANLNIESEPRDQIVRLFNEALSTSKREVIDLMMDNSINILHNNIEISKSDFKNMVSSFGSSNKYSLILEAYVHLINLNGDQIYRVVKAFEKDWGCSIAESCYNYQVTSELEDFKIDLIQKLKAIKSTQEALIEMSQKKDVSVLDKLSDLLTQNNADLLLLSFSGLTEKNANSNTIASQVISIMNKVVFEPFAKQAEEILDLKRKAE